MAEKMLQARQPRASSGELASSFKQQRANSGELAPFETPRSRAIRIFHDCVDVDNDGSMSCAELQAYLSSHAEMGLKSVDGPTAAKMFAVLDKNRDGSVSLQEWTVVFAQAATSQVNRDARALEERKAAVDARAKVLAAEEADAMSRVDKAVAATKTSKSGIVRKRLKETEEAERATAERAAAERQQAEQEALEAAKAAEEARRLAEEEEAAVRQALEEEALQKAAARRKRQERASKEAQAAAAAAEAAAEESAALAANNKNTSKWANASRQRAASPGMSRNVLLSGEFYSSHVSVSARESKKKIFLSLSPRPTGGGGAGSSSGGGPHLSSAPELPISPLDDNCRLLKATASSKKKVSAMPAAVPATFSPAARRKAKVKAGAAKKVKPGKRKKKMKGQKKVAR